MRIISKFKDYYDCLMSQSSPVYVRDTVEDWITLPFKSMKWSISARPIGRGCYETTLHSTIVGFCGEVFVVFDNPFLFTEEKVLEKYPSFSKLNLNYHCVNDFHQLGFNLPQSFTKEFMQFFSHECPIWTISGRYHNTKDQKYEFVKNPRLNKFGFVNHFDVQQTFQKIEMYLGNLAFPNNKIPEISDEDKINTHGFDKFSFRKDKSI